MLAYRRGGEVMTRLTRGVAHVFEAGLKRQRRTVGEPGHEATPRER